MNIVFLCFYVVLIKFAIAVICFFLGSIRFYSLQIIVITGKQERTLCALGVSNNQDLSSQCQ